MNDIQSNAAVLKNAIDSGVGETEFKMAVCFLVEACHSCAFANGWWSDLETGELKKRNAGELFMLMVSEIAEAMEGDRKNLNDEHLPHRKSVEVELADLIIRVFDYAGFHDLDLGGAIFEKLRYNNQRQDHKIENRKGEHGKKY